VCLLGHGGRRGEHHPLAKAGQPQNAAEPGLAEEDDDVAVAGDGGFDAQRQVPLEADRYHLLPRELMYGAEPIELGRDMRQQENLWLL
jgi:hypothetical protein